MPDQNQPSTGGTPCPTTPIQLPPVLPPAPCCCDTDPIAGLKQLFVDFFQGVGMAAGRQPATRPVFLRLHGAAYGRLVIEPGLAERLRVGVFGQAETYETWVRFSSDVQPGNPDLKGTCGIALKLFGVSGPKLLPNEQNATTHDFILQNHDVFFVDDARAMCEFTCASLHGKDKEYEAAHPMTAQILNDMKKVVGSVLATPYWSVLPYAFGEGRFVKYKLEPIDAPPADAPPNYDDPFYLRADLHSRLRRGPVRFRFLVQFQTNDKDMPLDAASVRWSEEASVPIHVATLELPAQNIEARGQATYGENLAYNPWHCLAEHRPIGSISEARKVVYAASAANRRNVNGIPLGEPDTPRPPEYAPGVSYPAAKDTHIVRAAIHPAIGIARVGNSESDYFVGPLVTEPASQPSGFYRDAKGALKRQAAQFRIYGYNQSGEVVRELTAGYADVSWSVHAANRKADWFQWQIAMDIPEAKKNVLPRRNANVTDRGSLVIDAGPQSISGLESGPVLCQGSFTGVSVKIGELRTDSDGRLLFLAGHGKSASPTNSPIYNEQDENTFINADGWYDDICDGPVDAMVNIEGRSIPVEPAWVVSAPPNYAPQLKSIRTLYDVLYDIYVQAGWLPAPGQPSFTKDVYPILQRMSGLQWVNQGFAVQFGYRGPYDFENPDLLRRLAAAAPTAGTFDPNGELRRQIFNQFRLPIPADGNQTPWPWLYGDGMDIPAGNSPRQNAAVSQTQHDVLRRWAAGDFVADWGAPDSAPKTNFDDVPLQAQPAMLDRAALEFCLADAFHPGCEMTWPMRHLTLYRRPFRIRRRPDGDPEPDFGEKIDQTGMLAVGGPLYDQAPGTLSRWMGLPWQADTAFCRGSGAYTAAYDPFAPTFWPAHVPNDVLTTQDYAVVIDKQQPIERRIAAFGNRTNWNKPLHGDAPTQMLAMVRIFGSMGLVEVQPGVLGNPDFPHSMMVASYGPDVSPADASSEAPAPPLEKVAATVGAAPLAFVKGPAPRHVRAQR